MSFISIVVPVYNNALSLSDLMQRFQQLAAQNENDLFEFIFVDDGSSDNSFSVLYSILQSEPRTRIVKLSRNFGSNAALLAGISQAHGNVLAAIAADLQDPPELIHIMLDYWRQGHKVVLAARESRDDGWLTSMMSNIFYFLFRRFAVKSMPDKGFDFFLLDRQVYEIISSIQENNIYLMGLISWLGFEPKILYYHRRKREKRYGRSMWTFARKAKYFIDSFVAFSYFPVRTATVIGITLSVIGLLYAIIIISMRFFSEIPVEGWASMMVTLLIVSGVQILMVGILGEYVWRNLDETRKRPRFIIDKVVEINTDQPDPRKES